jgi:hypothetical protein
MAYTSKRIPLPLFDNGVPFARADLQFHDLDHSGDSFEGRVFLNNPEATLKTPKEAGDGYAGSLYVFGHPHCWGDAGHCEVPPGPLHGFDDRRPHHLVPQLHVLEVTEVIRGLVEGRSKSFTVTVLAIVRGSGPSSYKVEDAQLRFGHLSLVTYD